MSWREKVSCEAVPRETPVRDGCRGRVVTYHGDLEAHATPAQQVAQWNAAVFQDDVGSGGRSDAQLVLLLAQRQAWMRHGHQEGTDSLRGEKTHAYHRLL